MERNFRIQKTSVFTNYSVFTILGAVFMFLVPVLVQAQAPEEAKQQKTNRESFERYFQADREIKSVPLILVGNRRVEAARNIKKAPGALAKRARLLRYQEERTSQADVREFIANNPVIEEVKKGEDKDFAQVIFWNEAALRITANDHTSYKLGSNITTHPFEQVGPARTSRAMAMVHMAMFEAINAVYRKYKSYSDIQKEIFDRSGINPSVDPSQVSVRHAIAFAAYRALGSLYPEKRQDLEQVLTGNLSELQVPANAENLGDSIGSQAARLVVRNRKYDGSELPDPSVLDYQSSDPKKWQRDPLNQDPPVALGGNWSHVRPFVLLKAEQFRPVPPPPIYSDLFNAAFIEVLNKGADPVAGLKNPPGNRDRMPFPTSRNSDEEFTGKFWAYDGTALLCAPPRLYNMIATSLALQEQNATFLGELGALKLARYLAIVNVAMADAAIAAWEAKYYYLYPRPVTVVRATQPGVVPGVNQNLQFWAPLGAPVSNAKSDRVNFTPPFPSYPSGHATFGGAMFQVFRRYWGKDDISFEFVSDEYNGHNSDPGTPEPRPRKALILSSFSQAERANADSRIYLGIHWKFDADAGITQGNAVGNFVFDNLYNEL